MPERDGGRQTDGEIEREGERQGQRDKEKEKDRGEKERVPKRDMDIV